MSILIATATLTPNFPVRLFFVLELKLWQVAALLVLVDLVYLPENNPGGHLAHLGGALYGYIFAREWKSKGKNLGSFLEDWIDSLQNRKRGKLKVVHKKQSKKSYSTRAEKEQQLNAILDKISKNGYDSLTDEEKEFLFRMSDK
jgi:hypothetical protein